MRELLTNDYVLYFIAAPFLGAACMSPFVYLHSRQEKENLSFFKSFMTVFVSLEIAALLVAHRYL